MGFAHRVCLLYDPTLIPAFFWSDLFIFFSYLSIPAALWITARRARVRHRMLTITGYLGAAFILLCGLGHLLDAINIYRPAYEITLIVRVATAIVSVSTAVTLFYSLDRLAEAARAADESLD